MTKTDADEWIDNTLVPSEYIDSIDKNNIDDTHLPNFLEGGEDEKP